MDKRLSQLKEAQQRFAQKNQISIPKIQRVPKFLRQNESFAKYCSPKIVSFGPIHRNSEGLEEGENYKLLWTSIFVAEYGKIIEQDDNQACQLLFKKFESNIEELKNMFTEDAIRGYNDDDLAWVLFVDGCSLLHFMENIDEHYPEAVNLKFDRMMFIFRDVILLENQLPSKMFDILCKEKGLNLEYCYSNYHSMGECKRVGMVLIPMEYPIPFHILDSFRSIYLGSKNIEGRNQFVVPENTVLSEEPNINWNTSKSIQDLKKVGIQVKTNEIDAWSWSNISFESKWFCGELRLPVILFNDNTPYFFRNLIAYELCPDVRYKYECCSLFSFMDSLIDNAEDVKELILAGVFQNYLGSDEELAKFFNDLGDDLPTKISWHGYYTDAAAYSKNYSQIKGQIEKHYRNKLMHLTNKGKTWLALAYYTYFNTPWAMIAFLAAFLALLLTFIQTWYAIHPKS